MASEGAATGGVALAMPDGVVAAGSVAGTTTTTYASGKVETSAYTCYSMTQPPGSIFDMHGVCDVKDAAGDTFGVLFGCNYMNEERTVSNCFGGLAGLTGKYKDRGGNITWHSTGDTSTGTGQWNN